MINKYYDQDCNLGMLDGKTSRYHRLRQPGSCSCHEPEGKRRRCCCRSETRLCTRCKGRSSRSEGLGIEEAAEAGNVVMMLVPDELAPISTKNQIAKHMKEGDTLMFAHGFNIHYSQIQPADYLDVSMVAPKGWSYCKKPVYTGQRRSLPDCSRTG